MDRSKSVESIPTSNHISTSHCGRTGCHTSVQNGMQCHICNAWYHFKCTGLKSDQVQCLSKSSDPFSCISCLFDQPGALFGQPKDDPADPADINAQHTLLPSECQCVPFLQKLEAKLDIVAESSALTQQAFLRVESELQSLNEYIALALPGHAAAKKALQISQQAIKEVAASITDAKLRQTRVIVWGTFLENKTPTSIARDLLTHTIPTEELNKTNAEWFRSKSSESPLGILVHLPAVSCVTAIMDKAGDIVRSNSFVRQISRDSSIESRRTGKKRQSQQQPASPKKNSVQLPIRTVRVTLSRLPSISTDSTMDNTHVSGVDSQVETNAPSATELVAECNSSLPVEGEVSIVSDSEAQIEPSLSAVIPAKPKPRSLLRTFRPQIGKRKSLGLLGAPIKATDLIASTSRTILQLAPPRLNNSLPTAPENYSLTQLETRRNRRDVMRSSSTSMKGVPKQKKQNFRKIPHRGRPPNPPYCHSTVPPALKPQVRPTLRVSATKRQSTPRSTRPTKLADPSTLSYAQAVANSILPGSEETKRPQKAPQKFLLPPRDLHPPNLMDLSILNHNLIAQLFLNSLVPVIARSPTRLR